MPSMPKFHVAEVRAALPAALDAAKVPKKGQARQRVEERLFNTLGPTPRTFEAFAMRALSGAFEKGLDPTQVALTTYWLGRSTLARTKKVTTYDELWLTPAAESDNEDDLPGVLFHHGDLTIEGTLGVDEGAVLIVTGKISAGTLDGNDGLIVTSQLTRERTTAGKGLKLLELGLA